MKVLLLVSFISVSILFNSCSAQKLIAGQELTVVEEQLAYYLYYPQDYTEKGKPFGLLLFLHGGGESGGNLEDLKQNGPPQALTEGADFPFLVLAPQNPYRKQWWNIRAVNELLTKVVEENNVDKDKIYLSGLSRGGSAAWEMAIQYPEKFAALMVVCGMAPTPYAQWLNKDLPIWVFHGSDDAVIPVQESDEMVEKLKQLGYDVKYTRYGGVGHNAWVPAYKTEGLYQWFASKKMKK